MIVGMSGEPRKDFRPDVETSVLMKCKRRCALCYGLNNDDGEKKGQLAHVDRNRANNAEANAVWLCAPHHDLYDTTSRQTKGYTPGELKGHQATLLVYVSTIKTRATDAANIPSGPTPVFPSGIGLDVYDRRIPIYLKARQFVRDVAETLRPELKLILKFSAETDEALFLFDESTAQYLETLFKKALRLHTMGLMRERMASDDEVENFQALVDEDFALAVWFAEQPEEIRARFAPFLRLAGWPTLPQQ
jgi:hypothetical protein